MAGFGPAPKDPGRRARRNVSPVATTILRFEPGVQPDLPSFDVEGEGDLAEFAWPAATRDWWAMWGASAQAETFTASDWSFLLDTALLHARLWSGNLNAATELRLRVAKFGATPEDRARLRMQFAQADEADAKRPAGSSSRERLGPLRALPELGESTG